MTTKTTTNPNANKVMWVEYWINKIHHTYDDYLLEAKKVGEKWECEIELPLIKKTIRSTSATEIGAILRTADKAAKLIDEYIEKHPKKYMFNKFKHGHWEILTDSGITYKRMRLEYKKKMLEKLEKMNNDSVNAVKKCINTLKRINGLTEDLFIHVLDESLLDKNKNENQMVMEMNEKLEKDYNVVNIVFGSCKYENKIILVGVTAKKSELFKERRKC